MDKKALYNLSYGVFMLATRSGNVVNGCITNTWYGSQSLC